MYNSNPFYSFVRSLDLGDMTFIVLLIPVFVIILIAIIVTIILAVTAGSSKPKNTIQEVKIPVKEFVPPTPQPAPQPAPAEDANKTVFLFGNQPTQMLNQGAPVVNQVQLPREKFVVLTDRHNSANVFKMRIDENSPVVIGRVEGNANLVIGFDPAISSTHCEISLKDGKYYLKDLGSSNGTYLDNMQVTFETPILMGQIVKLGRPEFDVSFIEE